MASKEFKIEVERREEIGKKGARNLRAAGYIPGIYYSQDQPASIPFKVAAKDLALALASDALVYHVSVGGERRNVLIKELQYHPVTDEILHVDFKGVRMDEEVEVKVPIHIIGKAVGVKEEGGLLHVELLELDIRCKASNIPTHFEVDISDLHLGQSVHAGDLTLGDVELVTSPEAPVLSIAHPKGPEPTAEELAEEEAFQFEEEGEEAEEGAEEGAGESGDGD